MTHNSAPSMQRSDDWSQAMSDLPPLCFRSIIHKYFKNNTSNCQACTLCFYVAFYLFGRVEGQGTLPPVAAAQRKMSLECAEEHHRLQSQLEWLAAPPPLAEWPRGGEWWRWRWKSVPNFTGFIYFFIFIFLETKWENVRVNFLERGSWGKVSVKSICWIECNHVAHFLGCPLTSWEWKERFSAQFAALECGLATGTAVERFLKV